MRSRKRLAAFLALCVTGVIVTAVDEAAPAAAPSAAPTAAPSATSTAASTAAPEMISMNGGDVITLPKPRTVLAPARVGTTWRRISAAARADLPTIGVAAVLVSFSVSKATKAGRLMTRPTGAVSTGRSVSSYGRRSTSGLTLVKLGSSDAIDLRTTAGRPSVSVKVVGYVPELAPLVVPESAPAPVASTVSATTRRVQLAGRGGVPAAATALVVAVTTSRATKAGVLRTWTPGTTAATTGLAYPAGTHIAVSTVRPDTDGAIGVRATGRLRAGLQVLGWSSGSTTLNALARPMSLASIRGGTKKSVMVAGGRGIPATAQDISAVVNAPKGATVRVWRNATGAGSPAHTAVSAGGALPFLIPVPTGRKITVRVTGTRKTSTVVATGYVSRLGDQTLSFAPLPRTRILGPGDVLAERSDATIDLGRTADAVSVGDILMVRTRAGAPYVARALSVVTSPSGIRTLSLETATLEDAFADYRATYDGPVDQATQNVASETLPRGLRAARAALRGGDWECSGEATATPISIEPSFTGNAHLDVDLGARSVDLSLRGRVSVTVTFATEASVSCTYSSDLPVSVPLGTTGLAAKLGTSGTVGITLAQDSDGGTFTVTAGINAYAAFWYYDGESDSTLTGAASGSVGADLDGLDLSLEVGFSIAVGPAVPLGVTEVVDASGSFTFGMVFRARTPGYYRGPKCLDVTLNPFAEIGASLVVPFLRDINVTVARVDFDEAMLYRGPCWGYSGTVTFNVDGSHTDCDGCAIFERHDEVVWTMAPEPAEFQGQESRYIYQPYGWTASVDQRFDGVRDGDPPYRCSWTAVGSGSGTRDFDDSPGPLLVGELPPVYFTDANEGPVPATVSHFGGNELCFADPSVGDSQVQVSPQWSGPRARFASRGSITDTWETPGPYVHKVQYALARQEFAR
jgi:hypothetical protein